MLLLKYLSCFTTKASNKFDASNMESVRSVVEGWPLRQAFQTKNSHCEKTLRGFSDIF